MPGVGVTGCRSVLVSFGCGRGDFVCPRRFGEAPRSAEADAANAAAARSIGGESDSSSGCGWWWCCLRSMEPITGGLRNLLVGEVTPLRTSFLALPLSLPPLPVRVGGDVEYSSPPGVLHEVAATSTPARIALIPPALERLRIAVSDACDAAAVPVLRPFSLSAAAVRSVALVMRFCVNRRSSARRAADESSMEDLDLPAVPTSLPPLPVRLDSPKLPVRLDSPKLSARSLLPAA